MATIELSQPSTASASATPPRPGELAIGIRVVDAPIGPLLVAASADLDGVPVLHRVVLNGDDHAAAREELERRLGARLVESDELTAEVERQLDEYFAGERRHFDLRADLSLVEGFTRHVIMTLADIPYGDRWSYAAVAEAVGHPRAHRAVGTACGANPIPLLFPCHRVIRSDGSVGLYGGGESMKRALLDLEAAQMAGEAPRWR